MNKKTIQISDEGAKIDIYLRENISVEKHKMPTVIICPGGGYEFISKRESEPMALAFLAQGFQAIVLNYPTLENNSMLTPDYLNTNICLIAKIFQLIEQKNQEWQINVEQIFLLGCSAGGHVASLYATSWQDYALTKYKQFSKPLGVILCYPVIGFDYGYPEAGKIQAQNFKTYDTSRRINEDTPCTFIWHTAEDDAVPVLNTLKYCQGLTNQNIKFECHIFEKGRHGLGLATRSSAKFLTEEYIIPEVSEWFTKCISWMERKVQENSND